MSGGLRERTPPDFFIGAHAVVAGHRLLTRDAARYRSYFPDLDIMSPETYP
jgi:predicted nucleic acid-binding protein